MNTTVFLIIFVFFTLIEAYIIYHFAKEKNKQYLKSVITSYLLFFLYVVAQFIFNIEVPYLVLSLVIIALIIQTYFGYYKDLFMRSHIFDRYLHAYGSFAYAIFFYCLLRALMNPRVSPKIFSAIFVFVLGIAVSTIFELIEFGMDKMMKAKTNIKMQRNLKDTDFDLLCNIIGSAIAAIVSYYFVIY